MYHSLVFNTNHNDQSAVFRPVAGDEGALQEIIPYHRLTKHLLKCYFFQGTRTRHGWNAKRQLLTLHVYTPRHGLKSYS